MLMVANLHLPDVCLLNSTELYSHCAWECWLDISKRIAQCLLNMPMPMLLVWFYVQFYTPSHTTHYFSVFNTLACRRELPLAHSSTEKWTEIMCTFMTHSWLISLKFGRVCYWVKKLSGKRQLVRWWTCSPTMSTDLTHLSYSLTTFGLVLYKPSSAQEFFFQSSVRRV